MKDGVNRASIERLARNVRRGLEDFDEDAFVETACRGLEHLELKARVAHVAEALASHAPQDPSQTLQGILRALPGWDHGPKTDAFRGFSNWPVFVYVETFALDEGEFALRALGELTHLFSAEFAVRPFLEKNPEESLVVFREWTRSQSEHVRRLASEGLRPRLPWGRRLQAFLNDPTPVISILDELVDDESLFVRRSVANCVSDIAVDHPELAIATCHRWLRSPTNERRWIAKRATRNLVKGGHPDVWALHGFAASPRIAIEDLELSPPRVSMDQEFDLRFDLVSRGTQRQRLVVDFVIHHVKGGGKTSAKVFKLCELYLEPGERVALQKRHAFRTITTRKYYAGAHRTEIQVNGRRHGEAWVTLE